MLHCVMDQMILVSLPPHFITTAIFTFFSLPYASSHYTSPSLDLPSRDQKDVEHERVNADRDCGQTKCQTICLAKAFSSALTVTISTLATSI